MELPSQINEHWATEPEVLKMYAKHYKTGEVIPDSLIEKILNQKNVQSGFHDYRVAGRRHPRHESA